MKKTTLHEWHKDAGARMGEFAGYDMPLFYSLGALKEHEFVRSTGCAGAFDISHMGQFWLKGAGVVALLQRITPSFFETQKIGTAKYTNLLNAEYKIIDDIIVTRFADDKFFIVVNAGTKEKDINFIQSQLPETVILEHIDNDLIALQGDAAEAILNDIFDSSFNDLYFMTAKSVGDFIIARLGYTGEDGFELSIPKDQTQSIWTKITNDHRVKPIGLAARDSLRLEMGYPLYGHDIDETKTPLESDLGFICSPKNKQSELIPTPHQKRVGIKLLDKGIPREGMDIYADDKKIGTLTSGGYSPQLKIGIGMGYIPTEFLNTQTISIKIREQFVPAKITQLPFIPAKIRRAK